jgi:predicted deacylase
MNQVEIPTDDRVIKTGVVTRIVCCIALSVMLTSVLTACDSSPTSPVTTTDGSSDKNAGEEKADPSWPDAESPMGQLAPVPADQAPEADPAGIQTNSKEIPGEAGDKGQEQNSVIAEAATADSGAGEAVDTPELPAGIQILDTMVPPGTSQRLMWSASQIFEGVSAEAPVLIVNGRHDGPTLCLTAAIHGDELNGIEMVRQVMHDLDPDKLKGAVIGVPIVNLQGFRRGSRYLPDRRDLNRYFPGNPSGSSAARIAHSFFEKIIRHCNALVDLHTGSFYRTNLPQLRADLRHTKIKELSQGFGGIVVLHSVAAPGTLRRAATDAGIPAITLEAGEPLRLQTAKVNQGVTGIFKLLDTLDIVNRIQLLAPPEPVFYQSTWVRANHGGILFSVVRLGQEIAPGDVLGTVTDPITNTQNLIYSPKKGRILGMALNQVVMPGFAAFRIGLETDAPPTDTVVASLEWDSENGDSETASPGIAPEQTVEEHDDSLISDLEETSE